MALEPITRKEKIIAGQDLTPITRLEKFLKQYGGGGGGDGTGDVYVIKRITNAATGDVELQGNYADALAAYESGKRLEFADVFIFDGKELVYTKSFSYAYTPGDSRFDFVGYNSENFITYTLTESGITSSGNETSIYGLRVNTDGGLLLKCSGPTGKMFKIRVSDTGELSTEEIT